MRRRLFVVPESAALWRILLALVLAFLPFSIFAAVLLTLTRFLVSFQAVSGTEFLHFLGALLSAGLVHELGHLIGAGFGVRIGMITTTAGMTVIRVRLSPEPATGTTRWVTSMIGGAVANLLVVGCLTSFDLGTGPWPQYYVFLHLLTALLNLIPFRTASTGPSDGWILWHGLRNRTQGT